MVIGVLIRIKYFAHDNEIKDYQCLNLFNSTLMIRRLRENDYHKVVRVDAIICRD